MFNFFEKKAAAKSFNFNEAYQFLKQEQKTAMFQAIAAYKSSAEADRESAWFALTDIAKNVLIEEKLATDSKTVQEFIGQFSQMPNQSNYTEASIAVSQAENEPEVETSSQDESTEIDPASTVTPRRFAPVQPVAPATVITPNIISAQQRGLGVVARPEQGRDDGDAMMARLIAEAQAAPFEPKSEVYISPYGGDAPKHVPPSDEEIIEALARENSQVPRHEGTIPERPAQHL